jgi:hypothetical protein
MVAAAWIIIAGTIGCGDDGIRGIGDADGPARRDSASIAIVENSAARWGDDRRWTVDSVPIFAPAATPSGLHDAGFQLLLNVHRLADGSVVVLDMAAPFVRAFAADGSPRWTAVGRGEGPGEVVAPALLSRIRGDSLVVEDARTTRSLLLGSDGGIVGALPGRLVRPPDGDGRERLLQPAIRLADGALVGYTPVMRRAELAGDGIAAPRWPAYVMSRDGEHVTALGEWRFVTTAQLAAPSVHVVFGATAALAPTPDGFLYGFPTSGELRLYDSGGRLRTLLRTPGDRRLDPRAEADGARAILARAMSRPRRPALRAADLLVDTLPAFGRVVVGSDGVIWRERFDPAAPPQAAGMAPADHGALWDVHDATGAWLGAVLVPVRFRLTDAGTDWVAGIHADADDVQTPRVYALRRR